MEPHKFCRRTISTKRWGKYQKLVKMKFNYYLNFLILGMINTESLVKTTVGCEP